MSALQIVYRLITRITNHSFAIFLSKKRRGLPNTASRQQGANQSAATVHPEMPGSTWRSTESHAANCCYIGINHSFG